MNFSAIGDSAGFTLSGANNLAFGANLMLGPLQNNGGTTLTYRPAQDSPLVDKGSNVAGLTIDQRGVGFERLHGAGVDIGAVEAPVILVVTNTNDSGIGSLRQAVSSANSGGTLDSISFDPGVFSTANTITLTSGELLISDAVIISGPGAGLVTVSGNKTSRLFRINLPSAGTVSISGITVADGHTTTSGGAILLEVSPGTFSPDLIMKDCVIRDCVAAGPASDGGGLYGMTQSDVTLTRCNFIGNVAGGAGGAVRINGSSAKLIVQSSTFDDNKATGPGGAVAAKSNTFSVLFSTITGNQSGAGGGGLYVRNDVGGLGLSIVNSVVNNNVAQSNGGGIFASNIARIFTANCTVSGNSAANCGGGMFGEMDFDIRASTVTANSAASGGGVGSSSGSGTVIAESSIIQGNNATTGPDIFTPLTTVAKSSAIGTLIGITTFTDQGGNLIGADIKLGPLADNGGPTLTHALLAASPCINAAGSTIGSQDQRGPGFPRRIDGIADIGAVEYGSLQVNNTNDSGVGSLRQAILDANFALSGDMITFEPSVFSTPQTIALTTGQLLISDALTIIGPGAGLVTISGGGTSRVFEIFNFFGVLDVFMTDVTIANGKATGDGGGILNQSENLTLNNCIVTNNSTTDYGGGIANSNGATLTLDHCTIAGNTSNYGGGIAGLVSVSMTIQSCTIINNQANLSGGGLYSGIKNISVIDSTFSGNKAFGGDGGGLRIFDEIGYTPVFRNSTISGNTSTGIGGGLAFETGTVIFQNCTIAKNSASGGGGLAWLNSPLGFQLESTILDGNMGSGSPDIYAPSGTGNVTAKSCAISSTSGIGIFVNQGGNLIGQDIKLAPLADNGGPTLTHALLPGSPAINAGSNPVMLTTDQRGLPRSVGVTDIGSVEVQPAVNGITVNGGAAQRSRLTTITVTFSASLDVTLFQNPGAVTLTRTAATSTGTVGTIVTIGSGLQVSPGAGNATAITLTFVNAAIGGVEYGSLADGRWRLAVPSLGFQSTLNDPNLRRLYGDGNADGTVDGNDLGAFGAAFGSSGVSAFDFNNDLTVDALDFGEFGARFGVTL